MDVRSAVLSQFAQVAQEQGRTLAPLADDLPLLESGLDSLCFAVVVARLEEQLGTDPFATSGALAFPVTVGDFVALYERPAAPAEA